MCIHKKHDFGRKNAVRVPRYTISALLEAQENPYLKGIEDELLLLLLPPHLKEGAEQSLPESI